MKAVFLGACSVGPRWIMSLLHKNGHEVFGIYLGYEGIVLGENAAPFLPVIKCDFLREKHIDIIGITVDSLNVEQAAAVSKKIKEEFPHIKIIWGGIHPSVEPEECIAYPSVDYICIGEGEFPMLELCTYLAYPEVVKQKDTGIKNIWAKKDNKIYRNELRNYIDINTVDFYREGMLYTGVYTSRGCAGNCNFCMTPYLKAELGIRGPYFRNRRVDLVMGDIKEMRVHNRKFLIDKFIKAPSFVLKLKTLFLFYQFHREPVRIKDDSFLLNKKWFFEFAEEFQKRYKNIGYICSARVSDINEKVVAALFKSNCQMIILGFESGDENYRNQVLNKNVTDTQIYKAAQLLHKAGIPILGQWMIGMPGETVEQAVKSIKMSLAIGDIPQVHIATPFPKTKMKELGVKLGCISQDEIIKVKGVYDDFTLVSKSQKSAFRLLYNVFKIQNLEIQRPQKDIFDRFYFEIIKKKDLRIGSLLLSDINIDF